MNEPQQPAIPTSEHSEIGNEEFSLRNNYFEPSLRRDPLSVTGSARL